MHHQSLAQLLGQISLPQHPKPALFQTAPNRGDFGSNWDAQILLAQHATDQTDGLLDVQRLSNQGASTPARRAVGARHGRRDSVRCVPCRAAGPPCCTALLKAQEPGGNQRTFNLLCQGRQITVFRRYFIETCLCQAMSCHLKNNRSKQ